MSRLHKKCFFASATMHGLLLLVLVVSPAFLPKREKFENLQVITMIPGRLIDDPFIGGGAQEPAPPVQVTPPVSIPPEPQPKRQEPVVQPPKKTEPPPEPEPVVPAKTKSLDPIPIPPKTKSKPVTEPTETAPKKPTGKVTPTFEKAPDTPNKSNEAEARAARDRAAREQRARVSQLVQNLGKELSGGTEIGIPGPGKEAYMNYALAIRAIYYDAWRVDELAENGPVVKVSITILRDGTVSSHEILQPSRIAALDRSVERALQSVKKVPEFPAGAKEEKREFRINFNLTARKQTE